MSDKGDAIENAPTARLELYCPACDASYADASVTKCPRDGTKLVRFAHRPDQLIGRELDNRFTIREKLGAGGMGTVYRALQSSVGREVAIKVIESRSADDRNAAKRFFREAKLASRLSQPNTVGVIDFGQTQDGLLFLVMELIKGKTLDQVLRLDGVLTPRRTARIGVQLCDALDAAHALKIVHRDLKPSNVMVLDDPPGRDLIKVLDFGLAKSFIGDDTHSVTHSNMVVGTPSYIAPEVVEGAPADQRTDLYSLGVILYELVTGRRPFVASNVSQLFAMHVNDAPERPTGVPADLCDAIMKMLEKRPDDRYESAAEARRALVRAGDNSRNAQVVVAKDVDLSLRLATTAAIDKRPALIGMDATAAQRSRRKLALLAVAVLVVGLASLAIAMGWFDAGSKRQRGEGTPTPGPASKSPAVAPATTATDATPPATATTTATTPDARVARKVRIDFVAKPRAQVWLDGTRLGLSPRHVDLEQSDRSHKVVFKRRGYHSQSRDFKATRDHNVRVNLLRRRGQTKPHDGSQTKPPPSPYLDPDDE